MDVWNPMDMTVNTIIDEMPMESGRSSPLSRSQIITLNNNTELIIFGGSSGGEIKEIWKYKTQNNSWELLGQMQTPRSDFQVVLVTRTECP